MHYFDNDDSHRYRHRRIIALSTSPSNLIHVDSVVLSVVLVMRVWRGDDALEDFLILNYTYKARILPSTTRG
jgi:hypothetical protein